MLRAFHIQPLFTVLDNTCTLRNTVNYYELGKKRALRKLGGMVAAPTLVGAGLGAGLGAWQAGEDERLQGALAGGLLGGAGGMIGGAAGSHYNSKALRNAAKSLSKADIPEGQMDEMIQALRQGNKKDIPESMMEAAQAIERHPEHVALGASSGALAGAGLGAGAGRLMRNDQKDPEPPQQMAIPAAYGYGPYSTYELGT